jgi:hypothetical protein
MSQPNYYQQWKQTTADIMNYSKNSTSEQAATVAGMSSAPDLLVGQTTSFFQQISQSKLGTTVKQMPAPTSTTSVSAIDGEAEMSDEEKNRKLQQVYEKAIG